MAPVGLSLFPVNVQAGDEAFTQAKVWSDDDRCEIWVVTGSGPTLAASGPALMKQRRSAGETFADGTKARWVLDLADGQAWLVSPGGGCGCSHPLKRFDPATAVRT